MLTTAWSTGISPQLDLSNLAYFSLNAAATFFQKFTGRCNLNSPRKNTFGLAFPHLAFSGILAGATLRNLRSGHSHEDIDQIFGSLALYIVRHARHCQTPLDFGAAIQRFVESAHRPFESTRVMVHVDGHRDWSLGF